MKTTSVGVDEKNSMVSKNQLPVKLEHHVFHQVGFAYQPRRL